MPSFDIVSEVDIHELDNAIDQANREISNRYDFKGADAKVEKTETGLSIEAQTKFQLDQVYEILSLKMAKRGIDLLCVEKGKAEESASRAKQEVTIKQGIDTDSAKKLVKQIKASKIKVQASIQGEKVRVTGKKRDDLQSTIAFLKDESIGLPLQFDNFRD